MRLSISWRMFVVSIRSWTEMSAVVKGMGQNGQLAVTPNSVPGGGQRATGACCPFPGLTTSFIPEALSSGISCSTIASLHIRR
jgi:hypothetical protein